MTPAELNNALARNTKPDYSQAGNAFTPGRQALTLEGIRKARQMILQAPTLDLMERSYVMYARVAQIIRHMAAGLTLEDASDKAFHAAGAAALLPEEQEIVIRNVRHYLNMIDDMTEEGGGEDAGR